MHLKKLIISGFKSFADKVTLTFDDGITGIVGPNGSGKSNVIDSVRWVMGEQNAKYLRGQVATDIIFAGSDKRKALGMAEVTLIFDNSDDSSFCPPEYRHEPEIALTRRLYVDGQREYLINRKPCRLKDIVGFFATTGLGGRSYSMIQQGQVDRILNAKPEDVREILEEAAGTLVFKTRKIAAGKKLEVTNDNLKRIEDIVTELAKQLDTLEGQVTKARAWKELSTDLREKELKTFAHGYNQLSESQRELQQLHDAEIDKEVGLISDVAQWETRLGELQAVLAESDPELDQIREEVSVIREQIVRKESAIAAAMAAIETGERRMIEIERELGESRSDLKSLEDQVSQAGGRMEDVQAERDRLQDEVDTYQDELERINESHQVFTSRVDELQAELRNLDHLLASNGLRCEAIERDRKRLTQDAERYSEKIRTVQSEMGHAVELLETARTRVSERQGGLDHEVAAKQEKEATLIRLQDELKTTRREKDEWKERFLHAKARHHSLSVLEEEGGDLQNAVAKIRDAGGTLHSIFAEKLAFNDEGMALAEGAKGAFERWAERVVVSDEKELSTLVTAARSAGVGGVPVTVLAMCQEFSDVEARGWAEQYAITPASRYLRREDETLEPLITRLFVTQSETLSGEALRAFPRGAVVFTAGGLVFADRQEFVIVRAGAHGSLSRRTELERLTREMAEGETKLRELEDYLAALESDTDSLQTEVRRLDDLLRGKNKELFQAMGELQTLEQQNSHKLEILEEARHQLQSAEETSRAYLKELEELGQTRISIGQERDQLESDIEMVRLDSGSTEDQSEEARRIYDNKKLELAKFEARTQALAENIEQSRDQFERLKATLSRRDEEKARIESDMTRAREQEVEGKDDIQELIFRREECEEQLNRKKEEHSDIMAEIQGVESKLKDAHKKQMALQEGKTKRTMQLEKMKYDMNHIVEQSLEKHHVTIETYEFTRDPKFDFEKSMREIHRIREKIEGMGAINMMAIEEHEKLTQRYEFIVRQREEVLGSIRLLEEAIDEIEETAKEKFLMTFHIINQNFTELFPILFPGGEARLSLQSEEDPLASGVDILVRLPGKKTQSMTLFSGGEKALTAISLIFALLKTKPTPFCFLDEVDAPLDEANVGRYNKVLEALSDRFQFIVITHNRRTMEVLDQLYGVTMQEAGVSKVVGVDMKKDLPSHLQKAFKQQDKQPQPTRAVEGASAQQ